MTHNHVHRPTIIVTGSRRHPAPGYVRWVLDGVLAMFRGYGESQPILRLVEGGNRDSASSVDAVAAVWGYSYPSEVDVVTMEADWATFGKAAGPIRNLGMAETWYEAVVLAFPHGDSRGTRGMMRIAEQRDMPLFTYELGDLPEIGAFK